MTSFERRVKKLREHVLKNETKTFDDMKVSDLKALLDEKGIEYDSKAKKEDLINLLEGAE